MKSRIPASLLFLGALFIVTLITGYIGWSVYYATRPEYDQWDVVYHTLLAFTGDATFITGLDDGPLNLWLDIARFTGLLATISAVLGVAAVMLRGQMTRLRAMLRKDHIVMIGASHFALDMFRSKAPITVFDTPENLDRLTVKQTAGSLLKIPGPMTEHTGTTRLLGKPATIVFGDTDPVRNVERARVWRSASKRGLSAQMAVRIENAAIARDLELLSPEFNQATIFSRSEAIARALVTSVAPSELAIARGQDRVHIVLVGLGRINLAIAEETAMRCHHIALHPILITIVDMNPDGARARIKRERPMLLNPDLAGHLALQFVPLDALECCADGSAAELIARENDVPVTAIIVAAGANAQNVAIAMSLRQLQREKICLRAPIFMRSDSLETIAAAPFSDLTGGIVPFGGRSLDAEDIELNAIYDRLARALHDRWRNAPDVTQTPENHWTALSNADKRASYRAALSTVEVLYNAGFVPDPGFRIAGLRLDARLGNKAIGDTDLIGDLAQVEHERWNVERLLEGWRKTAGYRDNEKKRHPLILPFAALVARGDRQEEKDAKNVKEALSEAIAQCEASPQKPHWRKRWRIGVIGPLAVDPVISQQALALAFDTLIARDPDRLWCNLEILTPNAPGFDRIAAVALASAWQARTGRPARLLLMNAAAAATMDRLAAPHVMQDQGVPLDQVLAQMQRQSVELASLSDAGHFFRSCDYRPLGKSDADLLADTASYMATVETVQDMLLKIADDMIFDVEPGAKFTNRALDLWQKQARSAPVLV